VDVRRLPHTPAAERLLVDLCAADGLVCHQLGAHLDRLDRARRAGLEYEARGPENDSKEEQGAGAEHQNADSAQQILRRAHDGSEQVT
jgi:hypothetical protein